MKKRVFMILLVLCLLFTSCTKKDVMLAKKEVNWDGYYSISYSMFTGTHKIDIYLGKQQMIDFSVLTNLGQIDIEILTTDDNDVEHEIFYGEKVPTGVSRLFLEAGNYKVYAYGVGHSGGFSLSYEPNEFEEKLFTEDELT